MPWGIAASVGGALVSSALAPSTSGGNSGGSYYVPTGLQGADTAWQNSLAAQQGLINGGNAYSGGYQTAANNAGAAYGNLANQYQTGGNQIYGQAAGNYGTQQALLNAGQQVYQNSLDPNQALYNQSLNNLQQQTGVTNSMYGLGSSAAGAGVANQALSNFGIDWNAQQLQNQIAGLGAYQSAANTAGSYGQLGNADITGGLGLTSQAPAYQLSAGSTPYTTANTITGNQLSQQQALQNQTIPYMNYGQGAQTIPYNAANQGAGAAGALVSQGVSGLGTAYQNAGSFGNLFGGTTGSFGSGDFSNAFTSNPYYSGGGNSYGFTS